MERRNAFALAAAVSMALVSATVALGANIGALGFAGPSAAPTPAVATAADPNAATQPVTAVPVADQQAASTRTGEHEGGEGKARATTPTTQAAPKPAPRGERDD
jgi:hypothetical protein